MDREIESAVRTILADGLAALEGLVRQLAGWNRVGAGDPEGVVAAPVGATFHRTDGGAGTSLYVKESGGTGNTGWVGK